LETRDNTKLAVLMIDRPSVSRLLLSGPAMLVVFAEFARIYHYLRFKPSRTRFFFAQT
jgi:hypothetical protein